VNGFHGEVRATWRGRIVPGGGRLAGYGALIDAYALAVPLPPRLAAIAERHHPHSTEAWLLLSPRYRPSETLRGHLAFALRYEGVDLGVMAALFAVVPRSEIETLVADAPTGTYARRIWYLYEWLRGERLDVPDAPKVRAVHAVDERLQFAIHATRVSSRHRVAENLPGTPAFCPLIRRTEALVHLVESRLDEAARRSVGAVHPDLVARASAFLMLEDSRSSFAIEHERPSHDRTARWAQTIAEAGASALSIAEFERLQRIVIGADDRFVRLGLRDEGGFVGTHDRRTFAPLPSHISAKPEDLRSLLAGIAAYDARARDGGLNAVLSAAASAFGFVYVHPFVDGNGRLHRWIVHHVLAAAGFVPNQVVIPVSAAILRHLTAYRSVLESTSTELLRVIAWEPTERGNVEVLGETANFYRYFDATAHAEFLYDCVRETIEHDVPREVAYLAAYDRFAGDVVEIVDMPAMSIRLLHRFLVSENGRLSRRARENEFAALSATEIASVERLFAQSRRT